MLHSKRPNMLSRQGRPFCFVRRKLRLAKAWQTSGAAMVTWLRRLTIGCRVFQPSRKRSVSSLKARSRSLAGTTSASMQAWRTMLTIHKCLAASYAKLIEGCIIKSLLQLLKTITTEARKNFTLISLIRSTNISQFRGSAELWRISRYPPINSN